MKDSKSMLHLTTYTLVVIGALNWGLVGLFNFNLVETVLGGYPMLVRLVYILVGVSAVYDFAMHKTYCKICEKMMK